MTRQVRATLSENAKPVEPLLKWPGGKRALLRHILPLVTSHRGRYFEPFLGGGAVFFGLRPAIAVLSDYDADLINCYTTIRDDPAGVIGKLNRMKNAENEYYRIRGSKPRSATSRAARTIFLSTLSFNGIYRKNLRGEFNVPYGYKSHLEVCDEVAIFAASEALQSAKLKCGDFQSVLHDAAAGDVVYLDPPYTVAHGNNGFLKYNAKIFSWPDQQRLAEVAADLARRKCKVVISNADHESIIRLYSRFTMVRVQRPSRIAAAGQFRKQTTECIFYA